MFFIKKCNLFGYIQNFYKNLIIYNYMTLNYFNLNKIIIY